MLRYLALAACTTLSALAYSEVTITPELQLKLDMMNERSKMKFAGNCKLAIADTAFCDCLADKVGSTTFGSFNLYTLAMSMNNDNILEAKSAFKVVFGDDEHTTKFMSYLPVYRQQCREQASSH